MKINVNDKKFIEKKVVVRAEISKHLSFIKEQITSLISNTTWYEVNFLNLFDKNHRTYVVEIDSQPVSFCSFIVVDGVADIDATATKQEFQNLGLASFCFQIVLPQLKDEGVDKVFLEVAQNNSKAQKFYEKFGFERQNKVLKAYYNDGQDAFVYRLDL